MASRDGGRAGEELVARLRATPIKVDDVAAFLDGLTHPDRVRAIRSVGRSEQRRLYEAAAGIRPLTLRDLVPADRADRQTVRHFGKNTLPAFSHFEKRFCRPAGREPQNPGELYGFNFQKLAALTGPGYYVASEDPNGWEVRIDYRQLPPAAPPGWPPVRPNEVGLARFVYGHMLDTLRGVSEHVTIGSAARHGRDIGSWFLLCRES